MIRTTINLKSEMNQKLKEVAARKGVEVEDIIIVAMKYVSIRYRRQICEGKAVQYQDRDEDGCWVKVHVAWFKEEYEFLIDLRKIHKKSVSRLVAEAIEQFLDEIWSLYDMIKDNYFLQHYMIAKFDKQNVLGYIVLWGKPIKSITH